MKRTLEEILTPLIKEVLTEMELSEESTYDRSGAIEAAKETLTSPNVISDIIRVYKTYADEWSGVGRKKFRSVPEYGSELPARKQAQSKIGVLIVSYLDRARFYEYFE